jgi:Zn-dependent protease with chaperone function
LPLNLSWIQISYPLLYLLGLSITLRSVVKLVGFRLGLLNLKRHMSCSVEITEDNFVIEANKLAVELNVQKPIQLRLVPSARQQNIIVQETKQCIYIFFLRKVISNGLIGSLAHELSHVALGHTHVKEKACTQYIFPLLGLIPLFGLVFIQDEFISWGIRIASRFSLLIVFLSFWIIDLPLSRKREVQADKLAVETVGKDEVVNFLHNFTNDVSRNVWGEFPFGTHPPISKRITLINHIQVNNTKHWS